MKKALMLALLCAALFAAGCANKTVDDGPAKATEAFYRAIVEQNRDQVSTIACADWEKTALREVDAFMGVKSELQDFGCSVKSVEGDSAIVTCHGKIAASYGAEITDFPLEGREHTVVKEAGEWRICGY